MSGKPGKPTAKSEAWTLFDRITEQASADGYTNPWRNSADGPRFEPDYPTLQLLIAVPLLLRAKPTTGVPALALDVWTAYELRRAAFDPDRVWPRATPPRIMPSTLVALRRQATKRQLEALDTMLASGKTYDGETGASANILGKNYVKQVDVVMSAWNTGPELMISTKRMDSSFGNNAANRVEESYGDAKNLRSRHPQAALGFIYSLHASAFSGKSINTARWIVDLLGKLGREDDAYDAVALLVPEWVGADVDDDADEGDEQPLMAAGLEPEPDDDGALPLEIPRDEVDRRLDELPAVTFRRDWVPQHLSPDVFFASMIRRVLDNCPINFHAEARRRLDEGGADDSSVVHGSDLTLPNKGGAPGTE